MCNCHTWWLRDTSIVIQLVDSFILMVAFLILNCAINKLQISFYIFVSLCEDFGQYV